MDRAQILAEIDRLRPWFHRIDLGNGLFTKTESAMGEPVDHPAAVWQTIGRCLPSDLTGKSVLDVGCNAGFYAIEAKRRGAARVLGVDGQRQHIRQAVFVRELLGLDIEFRRASVYDLTPGVYGQFDVTLALGLIYHCKHLVLALERLFTVTRELLIIETAIYPPEKSPPSFSCDVGGVKATLHPVAYIQNPPDAKEAIFNWFLPSVEALTALLKNVGFDHVQTLPGAQSHRAVLTCRKRDPVPDSHMVAYLASNLVIKSGPARCRSGEVLQYRIKAENSGHARWLRGTDTGTDKGSVHLVAHIFGANEEPISLYHAGAFLPHDVAPEEAVELEIRLRAPDLPGHYLLEFDMVSEHLAWFEDLGSSVVKHYLLVE